MKFNLRKITAVTISALLLLMLVCVPVSAASPSVTFENPTMTIPQGKALTLKPTVKGIKNYTLEWSTSNKNVCKVNSSGKISAVKNGTAVITAKIKGKDLSAKCTVTVGTRVTAVKAADSELTLKTGASYKLTAGVSPSNASNKKLTYTSSAPKIAEAAADGTVTALKKGSAVVTIKAADGSGKNAKVKITVVDSYDTSETASPDFDTNITAVQLVKKMGTGINIGNTLDAQFGEDITDKGLSTETCWGNPKVTKQLLDGIAKQGFNTVRIPVTWHEHMSADFTIDKNWMNRVKEVVDYAVDNDLYVIINMHHDNQFYDLEKAVRSDKDYAEIEKRFVYAWHQIGETFRDYEEHLIFESMNEPRIRNTPTEWNGGTKPERLAINKLNAAFVKEIRSQGGNNAYRFLMVPTHAAANTDNAFGDFVVPADDRIIVSIHGYAPYNFAMNEHGSGSFTASDKTELDNLFKKLNDKFVSKGVPVVIGETGCINKANNSDRVEWTKYYVNGASKYGMCVVWWDNGYDAENKGDSYAIMNRFTGAFGKQEIANALTGR